MVTHTSDPRLGSLRQENCHEFQNSLGYKVKPCVHYSARERDRDREKTETEKLRMLNGAQGLDSILTPCPTPHSEHTKNPLNHWKTKQNGRHKTRSIEEDMRNTDPWTLWEDVSQLTTTVKNSLVSP